MRDQHDDRRHSLRSADVPNLQEFDLNVYELGTRFARSGVAYVPYFARTANSSMDIGRILREQGREVQAGDLLIVGLQTNGQTTKAGRPWLNGPKDIAMTLVIPDEGTFVWCKLVELAAGIAVTQALRWHVKEAAQLERSVTCARPEDIVVKYPNDVRVRTSRGADEQWKKICGTLPVGAVEDVPDAPLARMRRAGFDMSPVTRGLMLLGIGVNVGREIEDLPSGELPIPAASVEGLIGQAPSRDELITSILVSFQEQHRLITDRDPAFFRQLHDVGYPSDERIYFRCSNGDEFFGVMTACSFETMTITSGTTSREIPWTAIQRFFPARYVTVS